MLKKILKSIFPIVLLKKLYLQYNTLRIKTIDRLLFPEETFTDKDFIIKRDDYPFRLTTVPKGHLDARLQQQVSSYENWTQDEYLLVYDNECVIEPEYGWALSADRKLIYPSLGFSRVSYLAKPSLKVFNLRTEQLPVHEALVSLRDTGEANYYHFYNDVLAKLFFLEDKVQLPYQTPLLISDALYKKPFFQYFLQHPYLKNRTWVIQKEGEYVRSKKTYFCKPLTHTINYYKRIHQLIQPQDIMSTGVSMRRIFITRNPNRLRFIENNTEIEAICKAEKFEIVDFDTMTLSQQIRLMSEARYVIAIHGAGMVNMMFRGNQAMGILEVFPPGKYYPFHYMLMAAQLGYQYNSVIGDLGNDIYSGGFYVKPTEFRQRIQALLTQGD